jgi:hypothetical protein
MGLHGDGSAARLDAVLAAIPRDTAFTDSTAVFVQAQMAYFRGDAATILEVWQRSGPNWRFDLVDGVYDELLPAMALTVRGEPERARPILEKLRGSLTANLTTEPENAVKWIDLALVHAILGDRASAMTASERSRQVAEKSHDVIAIGDCAGDAAVVLAWLGEKDRALAEVARLLRDPAASLYINAHLLRHILTWRPLQDDPRFTALLDDPANNAPFL